MFLSDVFVGIYAFLLLQLLLTCKKKTSTKHEYRYPSKRRQSSRLRWRRDQAARLFAGDIQRSRLIVYSLLIVFVFVGNLQHDHRQCEHRLEVAMLLVITVY
jgi:hypothetical protein